MTQEVSHARAHQPGVGTLGVASMSAADLSPIVTEVLRFEDLPLGSRGTRRAIARWSDGTESEALTCYADEILICEGDLIGKTRKQLRSVHFRRDRDWLQSWRQQRGRPTNRRADSARSVTEAGERRRRCSRLPIVRSERPGRRSRGACSSSGGERPMSVSRDASGPH